MTNIAAFLFVVSFVLVADWNVQCQPLPRSNQKEKSPSTPPTHGREGLTTAANGKVLSGKITEKPNTNDGKPQALGNGQNTPVANAKNTAGTEKPKPDLGFGKTGGGTSPTLKPGVRDNTNKPTIIPEKLNTNDGKPQASGNRQNTPVANAKNTAGTEKPKDLGFGKNGGGTSPTPKPGVRDNANKPTIVPGLKPDDHISSPKPEAVKPGQEKTAPPPAHSITAMPGMVQGKDKQSPPQTGGTTRRQGGIELDHTEKKANPALTTKPIKAATTRKPSGKA